MLTKQRCPYVHGEAREATWKARGKVGLKGEQRYQLSEGLMNSVMDLWLCPKGNEKPQMSFRYRRDTVE